MNPWLFLVPFIAAIVGWTINSLAVKMLFHPAAPKKILGINFHGLLPKRQAGIAQRLGHLAKEEFFNPQLLENKINNPANLEKIMPMIEEHIDEFLRNRLGKEMPMISMFIGDKTISKLKEAFMKEIGTLFPQVMRQYAANLGTELDIEKMISDKIMNIAPAKLESAFRQGLSKEIRAFKLLGAATGLLIGTIQIIISLLLS